MAAIYARLKNQKFFNYQTVFSPRFDEQDENGKMLHEIEIYINLNNIHNLTESDIDNINVGFQLEEQIQRQKLKDSR